MGQMEGNSALFHRLALVAIGASTLTLMAVLSAVPLLCSHLRAAQERTAEQAALLKADADELWGGLMELGHGDRYSEPSRPSRNDD